MQIFDVTLDMRRGMVVYPGCPEFKIDQIASIAKGASTNQFLLTMGSHTGTHVDSPGHISDGLPGVESLDPASLFGPVRVVYFPFKRHIEPADLKPMEWKGVLRVMFRTANSERWEAGEEEFSPDFVALTGEAAEFLAGLRVKLVGVDYLSVDRVKSGTHPAHHALLDAGITVLEGLNLAHVPAGDYEMFCGPLRISGSDGAPARVFLIKR